MFVYISIPTYLPTLRVILILRVVLLYLLISKRKNVHYTLEYGRTSGFLELWQPTMKLRMRPLSWFRVGILDYKYNRLLLNKNTVILFILFACVPEPIYRLYSFLRFEGFNLNVFWLRLKCFNSSALLVQSFGTFT